MVYKPSRTSVSRCLVPEALEFDKMKLTALSGGFFLLCLLWNASGLEPVISVCSSDWLIVRIERRPFGNDTELRVDDIYLGNNCSVTRVLSFNYEFSYPAVSCGISKFVFQGNVFILSEIRYRLVQELTRRFQVICSVKRPKLFSVEPFGLNRYSVSAFCGGTQVIGQESLVSSQTKSHGPNFSISHKDQLSVNLWINGPCAKNSFVP
ncbi:oocyte-secreted protein 4B isoform X2 [Alexandromys fortis]|uniref:oocyte-secreted protein 4B isoform X2 n=1 Tax=Alexandromys fortis TaxID=100897 RepID=UPI0021523E74|nr:oocyte-secreted protein 4B isoform X2 [Microtus fortis]